MIDTFEITKLCFSEHMSSHLIKMGSYNILCDVPLDMNEILEIRETIPKEINKTNVILDNNNNNNDEYSSYNSDNRHNDGYINISNLETSPGLSKKIIIKHKLYSYEDSYYINFLCRRFYGFTNIM